MQEKDREVPYLVSKVRVRKVSKMGYILPYGVTIGITAGGLLSGAWGQSQLTQDSNRNSQYRQIVGERTRSLDSVFTSTAPTNTVSVKENEDYYAELIYSSRGLAETRDLEGLQKLMSEDKTKRTISLHTQHQLEMADRAKLEERIQEQVASEFSPAGIPESLLHTGAMLGGGMLALFGLFSIASISFFARQWYNKRFVSSDANYMDLLQLPSPDDTLDSNKTADFKEKVQFLPPTGGKVISLENKKIWFILPSTQTAEQQISMVNGLREQGDLDGVYVHQMSIQGRLGDQFKYAAIALILDSPYPNDWTKPLYNAPWGKVAPLIHDGGNTKYPNSLWKNQGRTDFLQRVSRNLAKEDQKLLDLDPKAKSELPKDRLFSAIEQRLELERLFVETKFYQRIALAYHCYLNSAPSEIPAKVQSELGGDWLDFATNMKQLVTNLGVINFNFIPWFRSKPTPSWGDKKRYEADWEPIQALLLKLEDTRWKHPDLLLETRNYLKSTTESIDDKVGIS